MQHPVTTIKSNQMKIRSNYENRVVNERTLAVSEVIRLRVKDKTVLPSSADPEVLVTS